MAENRILAIRESCETTVAFTRMNYIPCWASLDADCHDQLVLPVRVATLLIAEDNDS